MIVLFLVTVAAGCAIPFFIEDSDTMKQKILYYLMILADIALLVIMVESGLAGLPSYGKPETIFIGCGPMLISLMISRLRRIIGIKHKSNIIKTSPKSHHKAAS